MASLKLLDEVPSQLGWVEAYIEATRAYIWVRTEDRLLILRPAYVHHLNEMGTFVLAQLLQPSQGPQGLLNIINFLIQKYPEKLAEEIIRDLDAFFVGLRALVDKNNDTSLTSLQSVELIPFRSRPRFYPVLSEIALTYRCNNSCLFCYAHSPYIASDQPELTTDDFKRLLEIIFHDAHVPSVSFTGGEPTLREDLPELIAHAKSLGFRVNLITNGKRCADPAFAARLVAAGLDSAQVSLEAGTAELHDALVHSEGAFAATVQGIKNLKATGINVHTNSTINQMNKDHLEPLVRFIGNELQNAYFSMNVLIYTGSSLEDANRGRLDLAYSELDEIIPSIVSYAERYHSEFIWYSPTCYHLFNPQRYNLGIKQCAACDGLLSLNPYGEIIPCSSFQTPIGPSLLKPGVKFDDVWGGESAQYWQEKKYVPPECQGCDLEYMCKGGCPLYWDAQGCGELHKAGRSARKGAIRKWKRQRKRQAPQYGTIPKKN